MRHDEAARCLLGVGPAAAALDALQAGGLHLLADFVAARCPLSEELWDDMPIFCRGIGRALPVAFAHSADQARLVVSHLPPADAARLRTAALCLARLLHRLGTPLPADVCGCILASFDA